MRLDGVRIDQGQARHAVRHDPDALRVHVVSPREQRRGRLGHDHGHGRHPHELRQDPSLRRRRRPQHRVQRRHDGHVQGADEVEHVGSVAAAPDAVLVLDRDDLDVRRVQGGGRSKVVAARVPADPVPDRARVRLRTRDRVQGHDLVGPHRRRQVAREGGNPTAVRWVRGDKCSSSHEQLQSRSDSAGVRIGPRQGSPGLAGSVTAMATAWMPSAISDSRSRDSTTRRSPCSRAGPWGRPRPRS